MEREMINSNSGEVSIFSDENGYHFQHRGYGPDLKNYPTAEAAALAAGLSEDEARDIHAGDWQEA